MLVQVTWLCRSSGSWGSLAGQVVYVNWYLHIWRGVLLGAEVGELGAAWRAGVPLCVPS